MVSHLFAAIPRQRLVEFLGEFAGVFDQGADDRLGILTGQLHQHYVTGMTLHKSGNLAVPATAQQVTLPVTWHRPILSRGWAFADGYRVCDSTVIFLLLRVMARATHDSRSS
ncbi:hypothetical protein D3C73_1089550 [compost metagenome]